MFKKKCNFAIERKTPVMKHDESRPRFATRFGVIATTVGSAVGLGNIWRFPYEAGSHGGGAFLVLYIIFVLALGVPVVCAEFLMGRASRRNIFGAFGRLAPGSSKGWKTVGVLGIVASVMILAFYSVVAGWTLEYLYESLSGKIDSMGGVSRHTAFDSFTAGAGCVGWTIAVLLINAAVLLGGVRKGIERVSNILMPILFVILTVLCVNSLLLPGAGEGLRFIFAPDFGAIDSTVIISAMGQAFFSLSLGVGTMMIYGSYFDDGTPLVRSAVTTAGLDTLVAVMAGIVIFPAVFTFGGSPAAGPTLVFEVLPDIFGRMAWGDLWAAAFFLLLALASITSTISMSEICVAFLCEQWHIRRSVAVALNAALAIVLGSVCALSFGPLHGAIIFGMTVFDLFDYVTGNILMPLGGMLIAIFVGWVLERSIVDRELAPAPRCVVKMIVFALRYIAPVAIALIFVNGIIN